MTTPKYEELVKSLTDTGVALRDVNGEFRSTYDIIADIAKQWDKMSSTEQAALITNIAGTRQQDIFQSLVRNFQEASGAMDAMSTSAGALASAHATYLDSVEGRAQQLKATFEEFSQKILSSELYKGILTLLTGVVNVLGKVLTSLGGLPTAIIAITAALTILNLTKIKTGIIAIWTSLKSVVTFIPKVIQLIGLLTSKTMAETLATEAAAAGVTKFQVACASLNLNPVVLAISAVVAAAALLGGTIYAIVKSNSLAAAEERLDESSEKLSEVTNKLTELNNELETTRQRIRELEGKDSLTLVEEDELNKLKETNTQLQREIQLQKDLASGASAEVQVNFSKTVDKWRTSNENGLDSAIQKYNQYQKFLDDESDGVDLDQSDLDMMAKIQGQATSAIKELQDYKAALEGIDYNDLTADAKEHYDYIIGQEAKLAGFLRGRSAAVESLFSSQKYSKARNELDALTKDIDNVDDIADKIVNANTSLSDGAEALSDVNAYYNQIVAEIAEKDIDTSKTIFGNIDMNNRQFLEWTEENLQAYRDAIDSWGYTADELKDSVSTVFGTYDTFGDTVIAFSPMLQTEDGPVLLTRDTAEQYIWGLIDELNRRGDTWTTEDLIALDVEGIEVDGQRIKGLIADVGDTAEKTAESMHYVGEAGALAIAKDEQFLVRYGSLIRDYKENTGADTYEAIAAVRQYLIDTYKEQVKASEESSKAEATSLETLKSKLSAVSGEIDNIQSAYNSVKSLIDDYNEKGYLSLDNLQELLQLEPEYLNLLMDENGQLDLNSQSYEKLAKAKLEDLLLTQIKTTFANILDMGVEEAAAYATAEAYDTETGSLYKLIEAETQHALLQASIKDKSNKTTAYTDAVSRYITTIPTLVSLVDDYSFAAEHATAESDSFKDSLNEQKDALEAEKDALEDSKSALEDYKDELTDAQDKIQNLIDLVVDYLKKQKEAERDVLEERKEAFDDLIEKEKEELATKKEAAEFDEKLKSKQNAVAKDALAASIAGLDDSSAGKKAKKEADDALIESRADLYSTLADHEYDLRVNALDAIKEKQDEYYDAEIQKIDDYLDNERQIYEDACREIENDTGDLYGRLWEYTYRYTTQTRAEFDYLWTSAQEALSKYGGAQVGVINIMEYLQLEIYDTERQIGYLDDAIDVLDGRIDSVSTAIDNLGNNSVNNLTNRIRDLKSELSGLEELNADKWYYDFRGRTFSSKFDNRSDAVQDLLAKVQNAFSDSPYVSDIYGGIQHYAQGTYGAHGGPSVVNEQGHEIRVLNKGDGILTAKITRNLSNLGSDPVSFLADAGKKLLSKIGSFGLFGKPVTNPTTTYAVSNGGDMPITITNHINGDVNPSTLKALEKAQKDITQNAINGMMKMTLGLRNSSRVR